MKPEVVALLVVNLLPIQNLALPADIAAASLLTRSNIKEHGAAADTAGGAESLRPVGTEFEARRKRSLPEDAEYQTSELRRLLMSGSDAEPNVADVGQSDRRWNNQKSKLILTRRAAVPDWGQSDMAWIRRRSPQSAAVLRSPGSGRSRWSEAGMEWIKRRGDDSDEAEANPVKRRWEKSGFSWMKRRCWLCNDDDGRTPTKKNQDKKWAKEPGDAADNWDITQQTKAGLDEES